MDIGLSEMSTVDSVFSSDCITLSTEYKFDDISTITEISDSELEDILLNNSKIKSNMNREAQDISLNVVKHTLESNIDLLSDQEIIKDLLSKDKDDYDAGKASNLVIHDINKVAIGSENGILDGKQTSCSKPFFSYNEPFLSVNSTPKKKRELINNNKKTQSKHVYFNDDVASYFCDNVDLKLPQIGDVLSDDQSVIQTLICKYHEQIQRIKVRNYFLSFY